MSEVPSAAPPAWVCKRDGRLEPFDADKISRSLFAATERLGRPDAFLARELTDGVVHFLTADAEGAVPSTAQVAETVAKVVRELGQPALAGAYEQEIRARAAATAATAPTARTTAPTQAAPRGDDVVVRFAADAAVDEVARSCLRQYSLQAVLTRDLAAVRDDGLLVLGGLEAPAELAGCVVPAVPLSAEHELLGAIAGARRLAAGYVALDGLEHCPALGDEGAADRAAAVIVAAVRLAGLAAVVNLNAGQPPAWAGGPADGPLFAADAGRRHDDRAAAGAALARALIGAAKPGTIRVDWHVGAADLEAGSAPWRRLRDLARAALDGAPLAFVFDRPRAAVALAEGLDRATPAALATVGLNLPRLATLSGTAADPNRYLQKLGSLVRLGLSTGVQKRQYLRRRERAHRPDGPALASGFLLERAVLVLAPIGLDELARAVTGKGLCSGGAALDFARRVVQVIRDVARQEARATLLPACVDGPASFGLDDAPLAPGPAGVAGLTPWEPVAVPSQLRAAGALHAVAGRGTAAVVLADGARPAVEDVLDWLRHARERTDVVRVRFVRAGAARQQEFG